MHTPLFSIIIPTYNSQKTISFCLESVLKQSYPHFEILVMDGASTDETLTIARSYKDDRIRTYSEKDKGIYDAMNKGIKVSKGDWLIFLGSDDTLYADTTLSNVAPLLEGYDVVYGNVYSTRFGGLYDGEFTGKKLLKSNISHQAIFFNRGVFDKVGFFNTRYKSQGDWDHNLRWFYAKDVKHKFIDVTITNFADGGLSSRYQDAGFATIRNWKYNMIIKKQLRFADKLKVITSELTAAIRENRRRNVLTIISEIPRFLF